MNEAIKNLLTDKPIAYHPILARIGGSITAGIFLSQLLYWTGKGAAPDGWIWKTQEEMETETALTRYEQEGARKNLLKRGILEEQRRGIPARMYYRVNLDALGELLAEPQTSMGKNPNLECGKPTDSNGEKPQSNSETTQRLPEITACAIAQTPVNSEKTPDPETTAWIADLEATVPPVSNPPHSADEFKAQLLATEGRMWDRIRAEPWLSWGVDCSALDTYDGKGQTMRRLGYELESRFGLKPTWSSKKATKAWLMGLADCLDASGGDMTPVLDAATKLLHDGLTVSGPTSLVKTTRALAAQKTIHLNGTPKVLRVG